MNDNGEYYNEAQIREKFTEQELLNDVLSRIKSKPWVDAMIETGTMKEDKDGVIRFTSKAIKKHDCLKDITVSREESNDSNRTSSTKRLSKRLFSLC